MHEAKQLSAVYCEDYQLTVDDLRQLLEIISKDGYGNMMLYLGKSTPLMTSINIAISRAISRKKKFNEESEVKSNDTTKDSTDNAVD